MSGKINAYLMVKGACLIHVWNIDKKHALGILGGEQRILGFPKGVFISCKTIASKKEMWLDNKGT